MKSPFKQPHDSKTTIKVRKNTKNRSPIFSDLFAKQERTLVTR